MITEKNKEYLPEENKILDKILAFIGFVGGIGFSLDNALPSLSKLVPIPSEEICQDLHQVWLIVFGILVYQIIILKIHTKQKLETKKYFKIGILGMLCLIIFFFVKKDYLWHDENFHTEKEFKVIAPYFKKEFKDQDKCKQEIKLLIEDQINKKKQLDTLVDQIELLESQYKKSPTSDQARKLEELESQRKQLQKEYRKITSEKLRISILIDEYNWKDNFKEFIKKDPLRIKEYLDENSLFILGIVILIFRELAYFLFLFLFFACMGNYLNNYQIESNQNFKEKTSLETIKVNNKKELELKDATVIPPKTADFVFEGGATKGIVLVGALQELEEQGYTSRRLVGTSAGAITASLLAAGYSAKEILQILIEKEDGKFKFSSFMDIPDETSLEKEVDNSLFYELLQKVNIPRIPDFLENHIDDMLLKSLLKQDHYRMLFSFMEKGGLYSGNKFFNWMQELLRLKKQSWGNVTLKQFYDDTQKDLSLVASNTTAQTMLILNHRTAPDLPLVWAVRMSMSIPFVWQEVKWEEQWGTYNNENIVGHMIVDGGVLSNFPINLLVSNNNQSIMGDNIGSVPVIGLLIDESVAVENAPQPNEAAKSNILATVEDSKLYKRILRLVETMTSSYDLANIQKNTNVICRLPAKGYGTLEFNMSDERMEALIQAGKKAMKEFLKK